MTDLISQIDLVKSKFSDQLENLENEYERWKNYKTDYDALETQLKTLPDKTSRSAMIPLGQLAFMPGKIIHTNEILVLLGERYYAERSAKQALEILGRRKEVVNENLRLVEAQLNSFKAKTDSLTNSSIFSQQQINEEGLPIMEIREELPSVDEKKNNDKKKIKKKVQFQEKEEESIEQSLPESVLRARQLMKEADEKIKQQKKNDDDEENKALFKLLQELEEEEEKNEGNETSEEVMKSDYKLVNRIPNDEFDDNIINTDADDDEDDNRKFSDDEEDDERYDREIADNIFERFGADDDEQYPLDGVVDQEDFTEHQEDLPESSSQAQIRSPADIFNTVRQTQADNEFQDDYPSLDDNESHAMDLNELIKAARNHHEPFYQPKKGTEAMIPMVKETNSPKEGLIVAQKHKLDNKVMKGAVMERDIAPVDLEEVEEDMDLREATALYQQKRQNMLAVTGGFSFAPKPEFEVFDEELPLPKKKDEEPKEEPKEVAPKKISRFKAARLGQKLNKEEYYY
ncbi:uncharacterized protein BX663DRAFT_560524 [Cokeromyces recurvatus]|uniref:uncharacterized protein n=1 Tax=Cokeromyces recurvatus TaxID=90255 RepID=UPI0022205F96|nr:uncharacterized protein BX663DRAFT_560524 [Cokeromyces recurvatus]KAI7903556.1 hypothetical protein BX663DRAFT_560524 [Cokeromyces recurvatus]